MKPQRKNWITVMFMVRVGITTRAHSSQTFRQISALVAFMAGLFSCVKQDHEEPRLTEHFLRDSIRIVVDHDTRKSEYPASQHHTVLYFLPNGSSIEWTLGKRKLNDDDWHVDIQHIFAQTNWLRQNTQDDWTVVYFEAPELSWPAWKRQNAHKLKATAETLDSTRLMLTMQSYPTIISSHSGGGAFINAFIEASDSIPSYIKRLNYIDSNYGYTKSIGIKLTSWLERSLENRLVVLAYNDSEALFQGRPIVSATGGTWYKTHQLIEDLSEYFTFHRTDEDSLVWYKEERDQVLIVLKRNPDRGIYHTEQVEKNGFIMSMLYDGRVDHPTYRYFGERLYEDYISSETPKILRTPG